MKIPIRNLYYLLAYAWDKLEEAELIDVSREDLNSPQDMFARVLESGLTHLLKRGLDRGYIIEAIDTPSLRGKVEISETIKRNLLINSQVHCTVDTFSYDVPQNQIIKATLNILIRCSNLNKGLRDLLLRIYRKLGEISDVPLSAGLFAQVVLHRNNRYYRFLLEVCRFIFEHQLADESEGHYRFRDFVREENALANVFERFVYNFYKREQDTFKVYSERFDWQDVEGSPEDLALLPQMWTDISLESPTQKIVIDTKFYQNTLSENRSKKSIWSTNLYQLFSYLQNLAIKTPPNKPLEGVLLYPTVSESLDITYTIHGHKVCIITVDLTASWEQINGTLLKIISQPGQT